MKKTIIAIAALALFVGIQVSCKHEIPVLPGTGATDTTVIVGPTTGVCFESDILPLFQSNCAKSGCHDAGSRSDGYQLDTYANIVANSNGIRAGNAANSKIYESLVDDNPSDRMPQAPNAPLTAAQINLIANWINEGARNTTNCSSGCDSTQFTYSQGIKPILQTYCLGCHAGSALSGGGIPLDDYTSVKEQVTNGSLYSAISHTGTASRMPKNANKLTDCKITIVRKWIQAGSPNN